MIRNAFLALVIFLSAFGWSTVFAQDAGDGPVDGGNVAKVQFAGYEYDLFANEPVQACVISREDAQTGPRLTYRLFVRELDGSFSSVGTYPSQAIGALRDAQYGDCISLDYGE